MISLLVKESGAIVNTSAISGVGGIKLGREWIGFSPVENGNSIEKIF